MCSSCLGNWYGPHRPNSQMAAADATAHDAAIHHSEHNAGTVHSCAFPPS
ncbi:hypothetical protein V7127_25320 [Bacillus sp. JJ1773]